MAELLQRLGFYLAKCAVEMFDGLMISAFDNITRILCSVKSY